MRRSEAQGVSPSAASYNMLLGMLQVEGQDESVRALPPPSALFWLHRPGTRHARHEYMCALAQPSSSTA